MSVVIHCPNCKNIYTDDPDFQGCCPICGYPVQKGIK